MEYLSVLLVFVVLLLAVHAGAVEEQFSLEIKGGQAVKERLKIDLAIAKQSITSTVVDSETRESLLLKAESIATQIEGLSNELPDDFRTIMPFNTVQADIYALNAPVLRAKGYAGLVLWQQNRWDPLSPVQAPVNLKNRIAVNVDMAVGEYRSEVLNLTNASDNPMQITIAVNDLFGENNADQVSVREVLFTDTYIHYPIAAALPVAAKSSDGYTITLPSGMTKQIWFEFNSKGIKPGQYRGKIRISADGTKPVNVAAKVHVFPFELPKEPSLAVGGWDYTHGPVTAFDGKLVDQSYFIKFLRDYGVNTPWAGSFLFEGCEFSADGQLLKGPDMAALDQWISKWRGAPRYAVFLGVGNNLQNEPMNTPRFKRMVGEWITAVVDHIKGRGVAPNRLYLLLVDEPHNAEQIAVTVAWAEAIKAAQPDVVIFSDPVFEDTTKVDPRYFEVVDVLCPMLTGFVDRPQSYRDYFSQRRQSGNTLMFYACVNGKHLDPISYHRAQFWLAVKYKAVGSFYWAFGDEGGAPSSFKVYQSPGHMFSPFFIDPQMGIVDGKHMQAIREGIQDYEYFQLLKRRIDELDAKKVSSPVLRGAKKLLETGPERVNKDITVPNISWWVSKDRSLMDTVRTEVLKTLDKLSKL